MDEMMELTAENVRAVMLDSLYKPEEIDGTEAPSDCIKVDGVTGKFGFHPERLNRRKDDIKSLLSQLPPQFMKDSGGGWSFLNACMTKDDDQWGEHVNVQDLLVLGIGVGCASYLFPREYWDSLPGGVPYFVVDLSK